MRRDAHPVDVLRGFMEELAELNSLSVNEAALRAFRAYCDEPVRIGKPRVRVVRGPLSGKVAASVIIDEAWPTTSNP